MGAPKQRWTSEEEAALKAGVAKHGPGKWRTILRDTDFSAVLRLRSNVDLKDKWRNLSVTAGGYGSREKARMALKQGKRVPKVNTEPMDVDADNLDNVHDTVIDAKPLAVVVEPSQRECSSEKSVARMPRHRGLKASNAGHNAHYGWLYDTFQSSLLTLQLAVVRFVPVPTGLYMSHAVSRKLLIEFEPSRLLSSPPTRMPWCSRAWGAQPRLDDLILEAIKKLKESSGSNKTAIASYIEEQYWPPADFQRLLSTKLKALVVTGKLMKSNQKYRIAPSSVSLGGRSTKVHSTEDDKQNICIRQLTKPQVDAELDMMTHMNKEEAAAFAAKAVAEAEVANAEAEEAARAAEAAEAEAEAAKAFLDAVMLTVQNKNAASAVH
ncbi:Histone H1 [Triticum urartu]|uniref:Histone H1 n=1 Tax=Triticum urartu TaxID=4572 RepID=M7ZE20_TRIUA|nr:Histone H1 [Triticum urartu]